MKTPNLNTKVGFKWEQGGAKKDVKKWVKGLPTDLSGDPLFPDSGLKVDVSKVGTK